MRTALLLCFLLAGCSSSARSGEMLSPDKYYKRDVIATVNGKVYEGVGAIPEAELYEFKPVEFRGDSDLVTMSTCEGILPKEAGWNVTTIVPTFWGWGERKITDPRKVQFTYRRTQLGKEMGYCPIVIEGLDSKQGRHSWGFFDICDGSVKNKITVECNLSIRVDQPGCDVCQSVKGALVAVRFTNINRVFFPKKYASKCMPVFCAGANVPNNCISFKDKDGNTSYYADGRRFAWQMGAQECMYRFVDSISKEESRITTIGIDEIPIRK